MGGIATGIGGSTKSAPELERLGAAVVESIPDVVTLLLDVREEIAPYESLPAELLRPGTELGLLLAARYAFFGDALDDVVPAPSDLAVAVRPRAEAGLGVEPAVRGGFRGFRRLGERTRDIADALGIDDDLVVGAMARLWEFADRAVAALAAAYNIVDRERAAVAGQRSARIVDDLLHGRVARHAVEEQGQNIGLQIGAKYVAFQARTRSPLDGIALADLVCAPGDDAVIGLTIDRAILHDPVLVTVGVGPAVTLEEITTSFHAAQRAFATATAFALHGVFDIASLGVLPSVVADAEVGDALVARYLAPLDGAGAFGVAIIACLRAFLKHGLRVENAARALTINHNTVRYRLRRYEELIGVNLQDASVAFEIWWALLRRAMAAPGVSPV
jgi:hypothetical protein